jgi:hypothetical protein
MTVLDYAGSLSLNQQAEQGIMAAQEKNKATENNLPDPE